MTEPFEIPLLATEASISLDFAMAAAEQMASHGIVESSSFESLMTLLEDAALAVDQIKRILNLEDASLALSVPMVSGGDHPEASLQRVPGAAALVRSKAESLPARRLTSANDR